jgi:hypothetical protein
MLKTDLGIETLGKRLNIEKAINDLSTCLPWFKRPALMVIPADESKCGRLVGIAGDGPSSHVLKMVNKRHRGK